MLSRDDDGQTVVVFPPPHECSGSTDEAVFLSRTLDKMITDTAATGADEGNRKLDSAGVRCWDSALSELVRQLTPLGTERAALLDKIREHIVDVLNWYQP